MWARVVTHAGRFVPTYAPELAQYVVTRGEVRVVPTKARPNDDAHVRATALALRLNVLYAEPTPERMTPGASCPDDACRYPYCDCPLAYVPADIWNDPVPDTLCMRLERLREADGAELADEGEA